MWEFGGVTNVARLLGIHASGVWRWQANDRIPAKHQAALLEAARANGINVGAEDLVG